VASSVQPTATISAQVAAMAMSMVVPVSRLSYIELVLSAALDTSGRFRLIQEIAAVSETLRLDMAKPLFDAFTLTDASALDVVRSVDGDETFVTDVFFKSLTYYRTFADTNELSDDQTFEVVKVLAEVLPIVEQKAFALDKPLADTFALIDLAAKLLARTLSDAYAVSDASHLLVGKAAADSVSPLSVAVRSVGSALVDTFEPQDILTAAVAKYLTDGVAMNDGFDLNDGSTYAFTKGISNVTMVADAAIRAANKAAADTVAMTDSGYILSQDYVELGYFLEDYVGSARVF